ncbi:TPA: hypothetical protein EYP13_00455, partial [Candidatus Micrarchaeota archaeon]|nr:hypothetical protein [Candidatus Micrarchaeota archaeon]
MRGFSAFAPVLGVTLIAVAILVSASITQQEMRRKAFIDEAREKIHLNALPEALKWDAISTFIVALRNWFYDSYIYTKGVLERAPPKKDLASSMLSFVGTDRDATQLEYGLMKCRYYAEDRPGDLADIMDVGVDENKVWISIRREPRKVPRMTIEINTPRSSEEIETLLFDSNVGFAIFYPAKKVDNNIENISNAAKGTYFVAGFVYGRDPVVDIDGIKKSLGLKKNNITCNKDPCVSRPAENIFHLWAREESNAEKYADRDQVGEALEDWLRNKGAELVQVVSKEVKAEEGVPYHRLVCVEGSLARALGNEDGLLCKEISKEDTEFKEFYEIDDSNRAWYARIEEVVAKAKIKVTGGCLPDKRGVDVTVRLELNFEGKPKVPERGEVNSIKVDNTPIVGEVSGSESATPHVGCHSLSYA